jgi:mRNA interferase RelE/StbE
VSGYTVYIVPRTWKEMKNLPGNIRQRVKRAVDALSDNPRPSKSKALDVPDFELELRRLRLDSWRVVYTITDDDKIIDVLTVRKRPPYDYGDLEELLKEIQ